MTPDQASRARAVFFELAETDRSDQARLLEQRCSDDLEVRRHVAELLSIDAEAGSDPSFLEQPLLGHVLSPEQVGPPHAEPLRDFVTAEEIVGDGGAYRLLRRVGEGGMGIVYEAEQQSPRRRVALKFVRPGFLSDAILQRFHNEMELLGQLTHSYIARIYHAGSATLAHPDGSASACPFFAMEFVSGEPLTEFSARHQLSITERLRLMERVCQGVQHAHQHGIIHRDLKPGNILIAQDDITAPGLSAVPKILDFGVARAASAAPDTTVMRTQPGQLIGTLAYMSPEQVRGETADIDTRSDVYSLGVMLYELLSGRPPIDVRSTSLPEAARRILEQEPTPLGRVHAALRGDVAAIVARALEKDKSRRYSSAAELGADIRRYLEHEPVLARPITAAYLLRKFVRRHRLSVISAAACVLAIIGGLSYGLVKARTGRDLARKAETLANQQRDAANAARLAADQSRDDALQAQNESQAMFSFLTSTVMAAGPAQMGKDVTLRAAIDRAVGKLDQTFADQPLVGARMRMAIAEMYRQLGAYKAAKKQWTRAMRYLQARADEDDSDLVRCMQGLGSTLASLGQDSQAEPLLREALRRSRHHHDAAAARRVPEIMDSLGQLYLGMGRYAEAEPLLRAALEISRRDKGPDDVYTLGSQQVLAVLLMRTGHATEALSILEDGLAQVESKHADLPDVVAWFLTSQGEAYERMGQFDTAEPIFRRSLALYEQAYGKDTENYLLNMVELGCLLFRHLGRAPEGESLIREAIDRSDRVLPNPHRLRGVYRGFLAECLVQQNRFQEALAIAMDAQAALVAAVGPEHAETRAMNETLTRIQSRIDGNQASSRP